MKTHRQPPSDEGQPAGCVRAVQVLRPPEARNQVRSPASPIFAFALLFLVNRGGEGGCSVSGLSTGVSNRFYPSGLDVTASRQPMAATEVCLRTSV